MIKTAYSASLLHQQKHLGSLLVPEPSVLLLLHNHYLKHNIMDVNKLVSIYKKVIEPKLKDWVIFDQGTCVIIYNHKEDLETESSEVLQKYGVIVPGTESADFTVLKVDPDLIGVDSGWIVAGNQPGILNYVSEEEGDGKEDPEIGLIGRNKK